MTLVVDTSLAIAWCIEDESTPFTEAMLERLRSETGQVPPIWPLEIGNALLTAERRGRLTAAQSIEAVRLVAELPITVADLPLADVVETVLPIAREHGLSSYDASYLELALRRRVLLATLEARMRTAAARLGVPLLAEAVDGTDGDGPRSK